MTAVKLIYQGKTLTGIESRGHSGYSRSGSDIVCAAVSTLMQALVLGLEDIAHVQGLQVVADSRVPLIRVTWPESEHKSISLLTNTAAESLRHIARENPRHVKIITEEILDS
ncbi:MAG: ribosomal-processing cysteine protease Prp [Synergistaceae bacterium]|nr:ribosomal-processing cysteine protease Prp [Synergistaceae bacterium]